MARRVVIEDGTCLHGNWLGDCTGWLNDYPCPGGGTRRVLDPGSYVLVEKVDGEWPDWALKISSGTDIRSILDALAGGEQP